RVPVTSVVVGPSGTGGDNQANTVLGSFHRFLKEQRSVGVVQIDRLEEGGFSFLKEKFQRGLRFPDGSERPLDRVLSFAMTCDGASHFASACDVVLGTLRHVVDHPERTDVNTLMLPNVAALFWKNRRGVIAGRGLVFSPKDPSPVYRPEYTTLRSHLGFTLARSVAQRREALGWTQVQLAEAAGVSRPTVSHVETERNPLTAGLAAVADALAAEEDRRRRSGS
ncbi:MAG: helix-turn-helix transcriptional regulator, partial [Myxococcota bacterium]